MIEQLKETVTVKYNGITSIQFQSREYYFVIAGKSDNKIVSFENIDINDIVNKHSILNDGKIYNYKRYLRIISRVKCSSILILKESRRIVTKKNVKHY